MIYCEACRAKKNLRKHPGWPYLGLISSKCEICFRIDVCHDVPKTYLTPDRDKTFNEKLVDKVQQDVYRMKCDELSIYYVRGPETGKINKSMTDLLNDMFVKRNNVVDWVSTYELRLTVRDSYTRCEEKIKSIGG